MASRGKNNPRFDHWCRVYRIGMASELDDGEETTIYEGKCAIYEANNLRSYSKSFGGTEAHREDMGCDIEGFHPEIMMGDLIDFDRYGEVAVNMPILTRIPSKMGTTLRFNRPKI